MTDLKGSKTVVDNYEYNKENPKGGVNTANTIFWIVTCGRSRSVLHLLFFFFFSERVEIFFLFIFSDVEPCHDVGHWRFFMSSPPFWYLFSLVDLFGGINWGDPSPAYNLYELWSTLPSFSIFIGLICFWWVTFLYKITRSSRSWRNPYWPKCVDQPLSLHLYNHLCSCWLLFFNCMTEFLNVRINKMFYVFIKEKKRTFFLVSLGPLKSLFSWSRMCGGYMRVITYLKCLKIGDSAKFIRIPYSLWYMYTDSYVKHAYIFKIQLTNICRKLYIYVTIVHRYPKYMLQTLTKIMNKWAAHVATYKKKIKCVNQAK